MDQRRNERSGDRDRRYGIAGDRRQFLGRACIIAPRENGIERLAKYSASRAVLFGSSEDPEQRLARALARAAGWPRLRWRVARDVEHGGDEIDAGREGIRRLDESWIDVDYDRLAVGDDHVHRQCSMPVERRDQPRKHFGSPAYRLT